MCLPDGFLSLAGSALQVNASDMTNWQARGIINRFGISKLAHAWGHQPPTTLTLHNYPDFLTKIIMPGVSLSKGTLHNCTWEKDSTTGHGGTTVWCLGQQASQSARMADIALLWLPQWASLFWETLLALHSSQPRYCCQSSKLVPGHMAIGANQLKGRRVSHAIGSSVRARGSLSHPSDSGEDGPRNMAVIDILRDRERGMVRYNQARRQYGLQAAGGSEDITDNADVSPATYCQSSDAAAPYVMRPTAQ